LLLGLGAFFFSQWFFFIRYWPWASAFIPTFLLFTVGIAAGILSIVRKSLNIASKSPAMGIQRHFFPGVLVALCIIQIVFWGCSHWKKNNRSGYWSPYEFYKYLYAQIEFGGVLVNTLYYFGTSYLHQCESYRLDITNLFLSEILSPQLFNTVIPERYPLLTIPQQEGPKIGETIINANIMDHPFYWDPTSKNNRLVKGNLQPNGLLFRITPTPLPVSPEAISLHTGKIETFFKHYTPVFSLYNDPEENLLYSLILESISRFFYDQQKYRLLIAHLMVADRLTPDTVSILNGLASAYANLCQFAEAEQYLHKSLLINPHHITNLENLGQLYLDTEQYHKAFSCYRRILKDDPENQTAYFGMGRYYEQMRNVEKAREYYGKVIRLNPETPLGKKAREIVSSISPHAKKEKP
ncbi:MAG: tetratricopeptide repeat protein, partial [Pseudomonadota bacterium]